jgi:hypothetical protein
VWNKRIKTERQDKKKTKGSSSISNLLHVALGFGRHRQKEHVLTVPFGKGSRRVATDGKRDQKQFNTVTKTVWRS